MRKSIVLALVGGLLLGALAPVAHTKPAKELKLFLRWDDDGAGGCGATYLSVEDAPDAGNGCAFTFQAAQEAFAASGQPLLVHEWPGILPKPVKAAPGSVKGAFTVEAYAAAQATLEVEVRAMTSSGIVSIGTFKSDAFNTAYGQAVTMEFDLPLPKGLVGKKVESVSLSTTFRGQSVQSYIELDTPAAYITLPTK